MNIRPLVSILMPTLNSRCFLKERLDSIFRQTMTDWELIVADSGSTDGTWEMLKSLPPCGQTIKLYHIPRGLYESFNFLVDHASGMYVYFATSDDTMAENCLQRMSDALRIHPECDLCDSKLMLINASGDELQENSADFVPHYHHVDYPRDSIHVRQAPHDFYLHLSGKTVYTSLSQLLIRRTLFQKTGPFATDMGRSADYLWGMKAGLLANVVYLPDKLASWRIHPAQVTTVKDKNAEDIAFSQMRKMAEQTICELDSVQLQRDAMYLFRLISFKSVLLPVKRRRCFQFLFYALLKSVAKHPVLLLEFSWRASISIGKYPQKNWLIYAYDDMLRSRLREMKLQELIVFPYNEESNSKRESAHVSGYCKTHSC